MHNHDPLWRMQPETMAESLVIRDVRTWNSSLDPRSSTR